MDTRQVQERNLRPDMCVLHDPIKCHTAGSMPIPWAEFLIVTELSHIEGACLAV